MVSSFVLRWVALKLRRDMLAGCDIPSRVLRAFEGFYPYDMYDHLGQLRKLPDESFEFGQHTEDR